MDGVVAMSKVMFSFPDRLVIRMKAAIPARERSKILAALLEKEIRSREQSLFLRAQELENDAGLREEMANLENQFGQDGLKNV